MGNFLSPNPVLDEDNLVTFAELLYLGKGEIRRIAKLLDDVDPGKLRENLQHRFSPEQVDTILPQIKWSPFHDSVYRVFSSKKDGRLSLQDVLDLCSAFSENCPIEVRAAWAFYIFDIDGDNEISVNDLIEVLRRLTCNNQSGREGIDRDEAEYVAHMVLQEIVFNELRSISLEDFIRFATRISEFPTAFRFRV